MDAASSGAPAQSAPAGSADGAAAKDRTMYTNAPPCATPGAPLNPCASAHYRWLVNGHGHLPADWAGWRLAGRWLVSPDGDRITPERLRGLLFRESSESSVRKAVRQEAAKVVRLRPRPSRPSVPG